MIRKHFFKKILFTALVLFSTSPIIQASIIHLSQVDFEAAVVTAGGSIEVANFDIDGNGVPIAAGTIIDQQYKLSIGMDFNSFAGGLLKVPGFNSQSPPNSMNVSPNGETGTGMGGFEVVLTDAAHGIGMYFGGLHPVDPFGPTVLNLLDSANNLIDTFIVQDEIGESPFGLLFFGVTSDELIKSFNVSIGTGTPSAPAGDYVWIDDVQYGDKGVRPVPEPAIIALFAAGLFGIGFARRRKE